MPIRRQTLRNSPSGEHEGKPALTATFGIEEQQGRLAMMKICEQRLVEEWETYVAISPIRVPEMNYAE